MIVWKYPKGIGLKGGRGSHCEEGQGGGHKAVQCEPRTITNRPKRGVLPTLPGKTKRHHSYTALIQACTSRRVTISNVKFGLEIRIGGLLGIAFDPLALLFEILTPLFTVLDTVNSIRLPTHDYLSVIRSA